MFGLQRYDFSVIGKRFLMKNHTIDKEKRGIHAITV